MSESCDHHTGSLIGKAEQCPNGRCPLIVPQYQVPQFKPVAPSSSATSVHRLHEKKTGQWCCESCKRSLVGSQFHTTWVEGGGTDHFFMPRVLGSQISDRAHERFQPLALEAITDQRCKNSCRAYRVGTTAELSYSFSNLALLTLLLKGYSCTLGVLALRRCASSVAYCL